jgi:hypothetical protein
MNPAISSGMPISATEVKIPIANKTYPIRGFRRTTAIADPQRGQVLDAKRSMLACPATKVAKGD